jgi:tRNA uridine 5-carboxymethylaminomethyl modification enzyme
MVDDLVTQPTLEPYRMFTSRSEYRLLLREDNADQRLTELGRSVGLVSDQRWRSYQEKMDGLGRGRSRLAEQKITPADSAKVDSLGLKGLRNGVSFEEILRRPEIGMDHLVKLDPDLARLAPAILEQLEISTKYEGYIQRQLEQVARFRELEQVRIPGTLDFATIEGLSNEVREKLIEVQPETLGQAGRIQGVTPAALAVLNIHLRKKIR